MPFLLRRARNLEIELRIPRATEVIVRPTEDGSGDVVLSSVDSWSGGKVRVRSLVDGRPGDHAELGPAGRFVIREGD